MKSMVSPEDAPIEPRHVAGSRGMIVEGVFGHNIRSQNWHYNDTFYTEITFQNPVIHNASALLSNLTESDYRIDR